MKVLIIEDDLHILSLLNRALKEEGYIVDSADNGLDGEYLALLNSYDAIILDLMIPQKSGVELLKSIREKGNKTPVLILSAKSETQDKVLGLNIGADDYLAKPFALDELLARLKALHRRAISGGSNKILISNLEIDLKAKSVVANGKKVELSLKEYELLLFLIKHKNSFVSKAMINEQLWSNEEFINSNVIEVTIYNLRKKIGKEFIKSYRNLGYKIED